jgi:Fe-S cluster assembly iron-binding protein IscA
MLQLTPEAAAEIEQLRPPHLPDARLLRIARPDGSREAGVRMSFVARARDGDEQGESQGIAMCVGVEVAHQLAGMVVDVRQGTDAAELYIRAA